MYPEVFTDHTQKEGQEVQHEFEDSIPIETISLPFSLLSLFGGKPKSSQLEIARPSTTTYSQTQTSSTKETRTDYKTINIFQNKEPFSGFSYYKNTLTSTDQLPKITTVTST
jgi:hypothetical protein